MAIQNIVRSIEFPAIAANVPDWFRSFVNQNFARVAMQGNFLQNSFQAYQLAVAGGAGSKAVTLDSPFPDTAYTPLAIPDWSTTVYVSAISTTGFTISFGTAAPGGGGTLRILVAR